MRAADAAQREGEMRHIEKDCEPDDEPDSQTGKPAVKQIWAPWRMPYLRGEEREVKGCVLCQKVAAEDDAQEHILYRGKHCYVVLNRYPYSNGHMMVVPYAHVNSLLALDGAALLEMMQLVQHAERILLEAQGPTGFNIGMNEGSAAGAGIEEHIHMHVVPRWAGDANYMTVIGETRVIPEMLDDTYVLLRPYFEKLRKNQACRDGRPSRSPAAGSR